MIAVVGVDMDGKCETRVILVVEDEGILHTRASVILDHGSSPERAPRVWTST